MTFLRTPQHPILQGLDSWDLQFWAPDHVLAKGCYTRPDEGSFVSLVNGAGDHGQAWRARWTGTSSWSAIADRVPICSASSR